MNSTTRGNGVFQGIGWVVGSAGMLLIIGAELTLFAQQTLGQANVATLLLALYLAFWSYVLGIVGLLFLSVRWLVRWRRVLVKRAAMSRYSPAEPRSRRLEQPEPEAQFLQQGVLPVVPSQWPKESDDGNKATSLTRVA